VIPRDKSVDQVIAEGEQLIADGKRVQEIVDLRNFIRKKRLQVQRERRLQNQGE